VVAISSLRVNVEVTLEETGTDPDAAVEELLCKIGDACPEVALYCGHGAGGSVTYEWQVELSRLEQEVGDLGIAVVAALAAPLRRHDDLTGRRTVRSRGCHRPQCARALCRPLYF
jgi:hypothetical protein